LGHGNSTASPPPPPTPTLPAASPVHTALEDQTLQALHFGASGDYRDPSKGGIFVNFADPSLRNRQASLMTNEAGQGISALGTPDPNELAAVNANTKAHMAEDAGRQYESDIAQGLNAARGTALNLTDLDAQQQDALLASQTGTYNTWQGGQFGLARDAANKPKWYESMIGGALSAI